MKKAKPPVVAMCENCGNIYACGNNEDIVPLAEVADLAERISPGEQVPVGECRTCKALVHLKELSAGKAQLHLAGMVNTEIQRVSDEEAALATTSEGAWCNIRVFIPLEHIQCILKDNEK